MNDKKRSNLRLDPDLIPLPIMLLDDQARTLFSNELFKTFVKQNAIINLSFFDIFEIIEGIGDINSPVCTWDPNLLVKLRINDKYFRAKIQLLEDSQNHLKKFVVFFEDANITLENLNSKQKIRKAEKIAGIGHFEYHLKTKEIIVSEGFSIIYEIPHSDQPFYSEFFGKIHLSSEYHLFKDVIYHLINQSPSQEIEYRIRAFSTRKIKFLKCSCEYNPLTHTVFGVIHDITSFRKIEEEIIKAKESIEESNNLKTAFLANMSHEIRTPMNGIIGFSELIDKPGIAEEKKRNYTRIIRESCNQLLSIVNDILDMSKIQTGQIIVDHKTFNINSLFENIYTKYISSASLKNIHLKISCGSSNNNAIVEGDHDLIFQVLNKLLNNAVKFTSAGEIEFGYTFENEHIKIFVRDTGIGISKELKTRIFENFTQADSGTSRNYGGMGLGLSIAKSLTELMGGVIEVYSEPEKGSEFLLILPLGQTGQSIQTKSRKELPEGNFLSNKTILIAEDEIFNYMYLRESLLPTEAEIIWAKNGIQAVDMVKQRAFDMILMDLKMPFMDGLEAVSEIRKFNPKIPVIAQTAYTFDQEAEKCLKNGFNDYITKPIDKKELYLKIWNNL